MLTRLLGTLDGKVIMRCSFRRQYRWTARLQMTSTLHEVVARTCPSHETHELDIFQNEPAPAESQRSKLRKGDLGYPDIETVVTVL